MCNLLLFLCLSQHFMQYRLKNGLERDLNNMIIINYYYAPPETKLPIDKQTEYMHYIYLHSWSCRSRKMENREYDSNQNNRPDDNLRIQNLHVFSRWHNSPKIQVECMQSNTGTRYIYIYIYIQYNHPTLWYNHLCHTHVRL